MIKSMTGYGQHRELIDGRDISFELKSVNSRYLDLNIKMPRLYTPLEEKIKQQVSSEISRGKIDVYLSVDNINGDAVDLRLNKEYLDGYIAVLERIKADYDVSGNINLDILASKPEIFLVKKADEDMAKMWQSIQTVAIKAIKAFNEMRQSEGGKLEADLRARIANMKSIAEKIGVMAPSQVLANQEKMKTRIRELLENVNYDEARMLTECAIFADKTDVTEELVRLDSHFAQFLTILSETAPVGRKLDFLVQEMNREVNTIGSKCNDNEMTVYVIESKSEIEKIREQIQNLE